MASAKTAVIQYIFDERFDEKTNTLTNPLVTMNEIKDAIAKSGAKLSDNNPANFWKDLIRKSTAEANWPADVLKRRFTGADAIGFGEKAVFRFVPLPEGQTTAFPTPPYPSTALLAKPYQIQSLSLPLAAKALGRQDENWLAQVAQRLAIVEAHFAVASARPVIEVDFLQTGVKLRRGEIDSVYRVTERTSSGNRNLLVSVEAKGIKEVIWVPQVARAATALAGTEAAKQAPGGVIPFAIKVVGPSLVYTVEFEPAPPGILTLAIAAEAVIELRPAVPGIR